MMKQTQKHIINKLQVDIQTNNSRSAFDLKDNINGFLKDDILPFLESYFSTVEEDLHSQVIQIPYLSVDVDTSSTLNYKELKEDVKRALTSEIKKVVNLAHPHNEEAKLTTIESSKENTFLHFLETGTSPWWMKSEDVFDLADNEFEAFINSKSFLIKFQTKLINVTFRKRIIQQLSDQQIIKALNAIDQHRFEKIRTESFQADLQKLTSKDRKTLWDCIIDDVLQKDSELFISRLIFQITEKLSENDIAKKKLHTDSKDFIKVIADILSKTREIEQASKAINVLQSIQDVWSEPDRKKEMLFNTSPETDHSSSRVSNPDTMNPIDVVDQVVNTATDSADAHQSTSEITKASTTESEASSQTSSLDKNTEENELYDTKIERQDSSVERTKESSLEFEPSGPTSSADDTLERKEFQDSKTEHYTSEKTEDSTIEFESSNQNASADSNAERKELKDSKMQSPTSEDSSKATQSNTHQNDIDTQNLIKSTDDKLSITRKSTEAETESLELTSKGIDAKSEIHSRKNKSLSEVQESLNQLIKKEDRVLFEELKNKEKQKSYQMEDELYINNAGLILLHPYLPRFFETCGVLDDNNNIINKDLAVHLLHYLATKQEQQFENNMLFEKVLCGVPIEQPVQRTIPISDQLKANAEELLVAVLENWGALKNASPDLLRGEFLQRAGKISFKEANPKITVERKVFDILLDKLPWNIGISRLPWLDHLLFTDW